MKNQKPKVAYFSMEFAFSAEIPNYAGGLGVLAADTMLSVADLELPVVGVSLIYHQDDDAKKAFNPAKFMKKRKEKVIVLIEDREVKIAIWEMTIVGKSGKTMPVFFLSTYLPENAKWDRDLTKNLYASDEYTRVGQEVILGIGGVRALKAMGYEDIDIYHMNEGHSAFLTIEQLRKYHQDIEAVKKTCTFTTHTPVAAGHDYFNYDLIYKTINKIVPENIKQLATSERLGMTQLALNLSKKSNSVAERHREVCKKMFPGFKFENVTNGIYHPRWIGDYMKRLFDKHFKEWQQNPLLLKSAIKKLPSAELVSARQKEKKDFIKWINENNKNFFPYGAIKDDFFEEDVLTIGFARRFVPYKRADLIFRNIDRLRKIGYKKLQLVFAGRCHPDDHFCLNLKAKIAESAQALRGQIKIAILPDYNLDVALRLIKGCDVWLNNPVCPQEASGTSGMKAALNGLLNLSILDGWWVEGFQMDPKSGWAFGAESSEYHLADRDDQDAKELLDNLEDAIDCYYNRKDEWAERMKHAISLLAFFNTHRLINEYYKKMWEE